MKCLSCAVIALSFCCGALSLAPNDAAWAQNQGEVLRSAPPSAQQPTESDESLLTLRAAVSEVQLVFTVTDKHGHYVNDLEQNDFEILDDRKPPAAILSFHSETDLPLQVGLLIDTSQSVRDRFKFEQEAAIDFLQQTIRKRYDQSFVIGFDLASKVTQDFTDDIAQLSTGIQMLQPGNLTAMYDAIYFACRDKLQRQPQGGPVRRAIILLSDGVDNASKVTREQAIEMAQQAEVSVYTIDTKLIRSGRHGEKNLERIADATGGRSYAPRQITEVGTAFAAIQAELRSQYVVSYKPAAFKLDGHYRTIQVLAHGQKGLHIRSRKGYRSRKTDSATDP